MRSLIPLGAPAATAVLAALLIGCDMDTNDEIQVTQEPESNGAEADLGIYLPDPVDRILIRITGCAAQAEADSVTVLVDPWVAHIVRDQPFRWDIEGDPESVRVAHRAGEPQLSELPEARPGGSIESPGLDGQPGNRLYYNVIARCGPGVLIIDPDIIIRETT
jgi:hypothetical protein